MLDLKGIYVLLPRSLYILTLLSDFIPMYGLNVISKLTFDPKGGSQTRVALGQKLVNFTPLKHHAAGFTLSSGVQC